MYDLDDNLVIEIFLGLFVAVILVLIMQGTFYTWLVETLLSYGASLFFLVPIAMGFIKRKMPIENIILASIGLIVLIIYATVLEKNTIDVVIVLLQTILVLTVLSTILSFLKKRIEHNARKWWEARQ